MTQVIQYTPAGEGAEFVAPDAVLTVKVDGAHTGGRYELFEVDALRGPATPPHRMGWEKAYYLLHGRMIVEIEDEGFDLRAGDSVAIPAGARNTFHVLTPAAKLLVLSMTGAMSLFHADLDATVPPGTSFEDAAPAITSVLSRHDVTVVGLGSR